MKPKLSKTREEIKRGTRMTRPPRLEGKSQNAMMQPVRKAKDISPMKESPHKTQEEFTEKQRKNYQLKSRRH
jgi:hypothetical protein